MADAKHAAHRALLLLNDKLDSAYKRKLECEDYEDYENLTVPAPTPVSTHEVLEMAHAAAALSRAEAEHRKAHELGQISDSLSGLRNLPEALKVHGRLLTDTNVTLKLDVPEHIEEYIHALIDRED